MNFFQPPVIVGTLPNTIANGQTADATPLMADLNYIVNQVNANAAPLATSALTNAANSFTQPQSGVAATQPANFPIATQVQNQVFNTLTSTLGTNTITARVASLSLGAYAVGQIFSFIPTQQNSGAASLAIDGLAAVPIFQYGTNLIGGEIRPLIQSGVRYDGSVFHLTDPTYVAYNTPAFFASNFFGTSSMVWTVGSTNVTTLRYRVLGKEVAILFQIENTTIQPPLTNQIAFRIPGLTGGFNGNTSGWAQISQNAALIQGTWKTGLPGNANIGINKFDNSNFSSSAGQTSVYGIVLTELQ